MVSLPLYQWLEVVPNAALLVDPDGRIAYANLHAEHLFGYTRQELLDQPVEVLVPEGARAVHRAYRTGYAAAPRPRPMGTGRPFLGRRKDGSTFRADVMLAPLRLQEATFVLATVRGLSDRVGLEAERDAVARRYALLAEVNERLLSAATRTALLDAVCRTLVARGGYLVAWAGWLATDGVRVEPLAWATQPGLVFVDPQVIAADEPAGRGPTGKAVRSGRAVVVGDVAHGDCMTRWHDVLLPDGVCTCAAVPLVVAGRVAGALTVRAAVTPAFDDAELALLERIAANVGQALTTLAQSEELRYHRALLAALIEASPAGIIVIGPDMRIAAYNRRAVELWGIPEEVFRHGTRETLVAAMLERVADPAWFLARSAALYAQPEAVVHDELQFKDGRIMHRYSAPVLGPEKQHFGRLWSYFDLTAQRAAERELRRAEQRYRELFDDAPAMYVVVRGELERPVIHDCNRRLLEVLGYQREEVLGRPLADLHTPASREKLQDGYARVLAGAFVVGERELVTRSGQVLPVAVHAGPDRDAAGRIVGVRSAYLDLSAQRQLEAQLQHAQRLESLGRLAGGIAHDFNNLLMIIGGFAELLQPALAPDDPRQAYVGEIRKAVETATAVTQRLLTFSRRQVGQVRALELNAIVAGAERLLRRVIGEDIALTTELEPELWPILGDPGQIEQVLINLVTNARDAMPQGGKLTLRTANVVLGAAGELPHPQAQPGDYVVLEVTDTGVGMDAETKQRLFEPFFTTKGPGKGTGLGLAIVYGIVTQSKGFIVVDSAPGAGATFRLYFPRHAGEPLADEADAGASGGQRHEGAGRVVLVVEDDDGVRRTLAVMLDRLGYGVLEAGDGPAALALVERGERVDLVVSDVRLPGWSGPEVVRRLRERQPGLPAVLASGYLGEEVEAVSLHDAQDVAFLTKPFTPQQLAQALELAVARAPRSTLA